MTLASPRLFALVAAMGVVSVTPQTFREVMNRALRDGGEAMREAAESTRQLGEALDAFPSRHELNPSQRREKTSLLRRFDQDLDGLRGTARKKISELGADVTTRERTTPLGAGGSWCWPVGRENDQLSAKT